MRSERRRIDSLRDIVKNCDAVQTFVAGFTREAFDLDQRTVRAVLYSLQTIGEAAMRLDKEEKRQGAGGEMERLYPQIPWRDVRGLSNYVRHQYNELNLDLIWATATESIDPIRTAANQEIDRLALEDVQTSLDNPPPSP
jgi:uncharacterized protein with HEPN domain